MLVILSWCDGEKIENSVNNDYIYIFYLAYIKSIFLGVCLHCPNLLMGFVSHPCSLVEIPLVLENNFTPIKVYHALSMPAMGSTATNFRGSGLGMNTYSY